jgi:poly(3-hydroxybutyrate) depolymerase
MTHPVSTRAWIPIALVAAACADDDGAVEGASGGELSGSEASASAGTSSAGDASAASTSTGGAPTSLDASGTSTGTATADGASSGTGSESGAASPGCGAPPPESGRTTIDVDGTEREYILALPADYDPDHAYRLVFAWHWLSGVADDVASGAFTGGPYYGLEALADGSAIFVAPEGIDNGWANPQGRDVEFARAMVERLQNELCIDAERIFSTGFSYGGMMSNAVGCALADTFRAIAPLSGSLWSGCEPGDLPIAVWGAHGIDDDVVEIAAGRMARDEFLARNGCGGDTVPDGPCAAYQGCDTDYPVVWCEWDGGHAPPDFAPERTWAFFAAF